MLSNANENWYIILYDLFSRLWYIATCGPFCKDATHIMSIIVSNCQHCDEQQFQTLSCVHYTIFSVVKLDLFIRTLLLDRILALEKTTRTSRVHLVIKSLTLYTV